MKKPSEVSFKGSRVVDLLEKRSKLDLMDEPGQIERVIARYVLPLDLIFCSEYSEHRFGITYNFINPMFSVSSQRKNTLDVYDS